MQIASFRPLRYNPEKISFISRVVAPPYDQIDQGAAEALLRRDPHNVIRLILGMAGPEARPEQEYRRAADTFDQWRREGILISEDAHAVYPCEEAFTLDGQAYVRQGLFCALPLDGSPSGRPLPHEGTMAGAQADRLMLMKACRANLSPIFGIFPDPEGRADALLTEMTEGLPLFEFCDTEDVVHKVWKTTDRGRIEQLASALREHVLVIADGHHRYECAVRYHSQCRSTDGPPGTAPEDYLPLFCVSAKNRGLKTLPTHRLAKAAGAFDRSAFLATVSEHFDIQRCPARGPHGLRQAWAGLQTQGSIGCYLGADELHLLTPKSADVFQGLLPKRSPDWQRLPVAQLHYAVLEPVFGIPAEAGSLDPRLSHTQSPERVYWLVEGGQFDAGFLLPPTELATVEKVARAGEKMPPKSTFFYPKVPAGLLFYPLDDDAHLPRIVEA